MNRLWNFLIADSRKLRLAATGTLLAVAAAGFLTVRARAAGIPAANPMVYSGYLETPEGKPMTDKVDVALSVWDAAAEGNKVCEVASQTLKPIGGRFEVNLPDDCTVAVGAQPDLWLEPTINGTSPGRSKLGAVPYAIEANHALSAESGAGALAAQLTAMQATIDGLNQRLDAPKTLVRAHVGAHQLISSGGEVTVNYDREEMGTDAQDEFNTSTKVFTAKSHRRLRVFAAARFPYANAGDRFQLKIRKNGSERTHNNQMVPRADEFTLTVSDTFDVAPGDTIDIRFLHNSVDTDRQITGDDLLSYLTIEEIAS